MSLTLIASIDMNREWTRLTDFISTQGRAMGPNEWIGFCGMVVLLGFFFLRSSGPRI